MCIIVDINTLASVFNQKSDNHIEFRPVREWILEGKGKIVFGGTKYMNELGKTKYLKLFRNLKSANKAVHIPDEEVNKQELLISEQESDPDFDDPHIIAIAIVSKCLLVCSVDARSYPFIKNSKLYPPHISRPKIYSSSSNKDLLCDWHIADCCKPAAKVKGLVDLDDAA
jgi:hypothetical protein